MVRYLQPRGSTQFEIHLVINIFLNLKNRGSNGAFVFCFCEKWFFFLEKIDLQKIVVVMFFDWLIFMHMHTFLLSYLVIFPKAHFCFRPYITY